MEILTALIAAAALILVGIPIGYVLIAASVLAIWLTTSTPLVVVPLRLFNGTDSFPLVAIPLFILAGSLMNHAGISRRLTDFASSIVGWMRGGLAMTTTASSMLFSEMSGSAVADAAALGSVLIPAMKERGYPAAFAAAVLSSSATIAILIPPSIPMILYGAVTGASIARLFLAGVVPGVLAGAFIMLVSRMLARRGGFGDSEPFRWSRAVTAARAAAWPLLIPAVILGGIFLGWFTATEAAAVAVLLALLMGVAGYRTVGFTAVRDAFTESARQTAVVMLLVAGSAVLGWYLANQQAPERLTGWVLSLADSPWAVALILNGVLLLAGTILHSAAAIVLLVPILLPLAESAGIGTVHFGMMVTVSLAVGQQTPPVASVLITTCSIAKTEISKVMRVNVFFIAALLVVLGIVTFWPEAALFLPDLFLGRAGP